jgi:hypothetical protein
MQDADAMAEDWIVRVQEREYGPVDLETLQEWKKEGRVLPTNEVRKEDVDLWIKAAEVPGLFAVVESVPSSVHDISGRSLHGILAETWRIYRKGFWQFLCLSALVVVPSVCGQLSSAALSSVSPTTEIDLRTSLAALFNLGVLLLTVAAWPVYIAGIQILTTELAAGRSIAVVDLIQRSLKVWTRVAVLCLMVYGSYIFWTVLLFSVLAIAVAAPSVLSIFFVLSALAVWVWLIGRLWVNFLFWQQFALLTDADFTSALRHSKELARSHPDLPRFRRPLWRGVLIASLWFALVLLFSAGQIWSALDFYFREVSTATDPQALMRSMSEHAKLAGFSWANFTLWLVQKILQPLLGIAFVLLYFDSKNSSGVVREVSLQDDI